MRDEVDSRDRSSMAFESEQSDLHHSVPNDDFPLCSPAGEPGSLMIECHGRDALLVPIEGNNLGRLYFGSGGVGRPEVDRAVGIGDSEGAWGGRAGC
jgi:hypothetical protein